MGTWDSWLVYRLTILINYSVWIYDRSTVINNSMIFFCFARARAQSCRSVFTELAAELTSIALWFHISVYARTLKSNNAIIRAFVMRSGYSRECARIARNHPPSCIFTSSIKPKACFQHQNMRKDFINFKFKHNLLKIVKEKELK